MIKELSDLGKSVCEEKYREWNHVALKEEAISIELVIDLEGNFKRFEPIEKTNTIAEALNSKKGSARLLLDKAEEVLFYGGMDSLKKHILFLEKLGIYQHLSVLKPVVEFYSSNNINGLGKALKNFDSFIPEKGRSGNIGFRILQEGIRIHEKPEVRNEIISVYVAKKKDSPRKKCAVCGQSEFPVEDEPHGPIKNVPDGKAGCALVSYNAPAFESFDLRGNNNSSICANCARNYIEGINWLLVKDNRHRKNFGADTAMIYWTRTNQALSEIDLLDAPDKGEVARMIESLSSGNEHGSDYLKTESFYSCTLSGAAARIAVRDWIETSLVDFRSSIVQWFKDIAISRYDFEQKKIVPVYSPLYALAKCCQRQKDAKKFDDDDNTWARVASNLWKAAIYNSTRQNNPVPIWILSKVLQRARADRSSGKTETLTQFYKHGVTPERAALIKLILNRNLMLSQKRVRLQLAEILRCY